jgi:paraquat-inducible protein B
VYYRQIRVGEVEGYELVKDGQAVNVKIFVHAPYHELVREHTRFWNAGGLDVSLDASGVKVNTESFMSILLGGVAFETPVSLESGEVAQEGQVFTLYASREKSYEKTYLEKRYFVLNFKESVRGLDRGAPVEFRGIKIGQVRDIKLEASRDTLEFKIPVLIEIEPERISITGKETVAREKVMERLVERGLRAQLKTGSLITGQLFVSLDFYPDAPHGQVAYAGRYPEIPTIPATLQAVTDAVNKFVVRLEKLPLEQTVTELRQGLKALNETITQTRVLMSRLGEEVAPQAKTTLEQAEKTLASVEGLTNSDAPLHQDLQRAIQELAETARSMRILTDYLQRHPDSMLYGKGDDQ